MSAKLELTLLDRAVLWTREYGELVFWLLAWPLLTGSAVIYLTNYHPGVSVWVHVVVMGAFPIAKLVLLVDRARKR